MYATSLSEVRERLRASAGKPQDLGFLPDPGRILPNLCEKLTAEVQGFSDLAPGKSCPSLGRPLRQFARIFASARIDGQNLVERRRFSRDNCAQVCAL